MNILKFIIGEVTMTYLLEVVSIIIALCALLFTAWQVPVQRKHNKLSMKPYLFCHTHTNEYDNALVWKAEVINNGIGPAFITKFKIYYKGEPMSINDALKNVLVNVEYKILHTHELGDGAALKSGGSITCAKVMFKGKGLTDRI